MAYDDWKLATPPEYAEQSCVRDDSTECGCPRCVAAEDRFWDERVSHECLATLAHNLAIAGALCDVWYRALDEAEDHRLYHEHGYRMATCWSPGCGHATPGWGR